MNVAAARGDPDAASRVVEAISDPCFGSPRGECSRVAIACYWRAARDGALNAQALIGSLVIGALIMASPVVLLLIKDRPYFRQGR